MKKVIEILSYCLKPGTRDEFLKVMTEESLPMLRRWGFDIVSYGSSIHDDDSCYLIRAYLDLNDLQNSEKAFYGSSEWKEGPRESIVSKIVTDTTIVIEMEEAKIGNLRMAENAG